MSIPTVYIKGSKKMANLQLADGQKLFGLKFDLYGSERVSLASMPDGTVIKFYDKFVGGNPYAKAYGNWRPARNKIV